MRWMLLLFCWAYAIFHLGNLAFANCSLHSKALESKTNTQATRKDFRFVQAQHTPARIKQKHLLLLLSFWNCFYSLGICLSVKSCALLNSFCVSFIVYAHGRYEFFFFLSLLSLVFGPPLLLLLLLLSSCGFRGTFFSSHFQRSRASIRFTFTLFSNRMWQTITWHFFFSYGFCVKSRKCTLL